MRPPLDPVLIQARIKETSITRVDVHDEVTSTNALAQDQREPWVAVVADYQTGGRGRLSRTWSETPRAGLAVSVLVPTPPYAVGWLPLLTGLALRRAIAASVDVRADLKWPNDLLDPATGRKLAGILCEVTPAGVVIGTGLNVDHQRDELPVPTATSLALVTGRAPGELDRGAVLTAYLIALCEAYAVLLARGDRLRSAQAEYRAACTTIGADVEIDRGGGALVRARASGVDDDGRLLVRDADGRASALAAGDVRHVRVGE